jgi:hypothetical protein
MEGVSMSVCVQGRSRLLVAAVALLALLVGLMLAAGSFAPAAHAKGKGLSSCPQNKYPGWKVKNISCKKAVSENSKVGASCLDVGSTGKCSFKKHGWKCTDTGKAVKQGVKFTRKCTRTKKGVDQAFQSSGIFTG